MIEVISTDKFKNDVFNYETQQEWSYDKDQPLIVNFTAAWCGPCRMFAPVLEGIAETYQNKLKILKVDIDATPELPALFGIRSVPSTLFIAKGKEPAIAMGVMQEDSMKQAIRELLEISE